MAHEPEIRPTDAGATVRPPRTFWSFVPRWLYSMKFAIWVAVALALVSVAGVLIQEFYPVHDAAEARALEQRLPAPVVRAFFALHLHDPFRAGWFRLLLGALGASLALCSVRRFRSALKQAFQLHPMREPHALLMMQSSATLHAASPEIFEQTVTRLRRRLFRGTVERGPDERMAALHHGGIARTGPVFLHLGILALVFAGLVSSIVGRKTYVQVGAGQKVAIEKSPFVLRVDDFQVERAPQGAVRQYRSQIALLRDNVEVATREVSVNHPMRHAGYNIYQASYGMDPDRAGSLVFDVQPAAAQPVGASAGHAHVAAQAASGMQAANEGRIEATMDGKYEVPGHPGWEFRVVKFFASLQLTAEGPRNSGREFSNPAALLEIVHDGKPAGTQWTFLRFPAMARTDLPFVLEMRDAQPALYTGLEVNTNPGTPLVWLGFALSTAGLLLAFLIRHRCIFLLARPDARGWTLWMAGRSDRERIRFAREFEGLVNEVRESARRGRAGRAAIPVTHPEPQVEAAGGGLLTPFA